MRASLLSREAQLLLLTAGGPDNDAEVRRLLNGELDWARLSRLAYGERATLIVWRFLERIGVDPVPPDVVTAWRQLAMVLEFQSLRLERLLHQALEVLTIRGIDVMLLKGGALAYTAYRAFQDRPMWDVDLLVRPDRAEEAWSLLQKEGWKWWYHRFPAEWYRTHHHLPPLFDESSASVGLEIHRAPLPTGQPFLLGPQTLWQRAKRITVTGQAVWVPDLVDALLHLCVHFAWSHELRLGAWRAFRDVATIVGAVDWAAFVDLARKSRAVTACYWTLRLARNLAGSQVPEDVLHALRPRVPAWVLNSLERHYVLDLFPTEGSCPSVKLRRRLWELGMAPRSSEHGTARPWKIPIEGMNASATSRVWSGLLNQVRGVRAAVGYLGRITGTRALPASAAPKTPSVPQWTSHSRIPSARTTSFP